MALLGDFYYFLGYLRKMIMYSIKCNISVVGLVACAPSKDAK